MILNQTNTRKITITFLITLFVAAFFVLFFLESGKKNISKNQNKETSQIDVKNIKNNEIQTLQKEENKKKILEKKESLKNQNEEKILKTNSIATSISTPQELETPKKIKEQNNFLEDKKYLPRLDLNYKYNNERRIGRLEALIPVWQNNTVLFYSDLRGWLDNYQTKEGNIGFGVRKIFDDQFIFGLYGFYDSKISESGNKFHQGTFGSEILTKNWDFRFNAYFPENKIKETDILNFNSVQLQGSGVSSGLKSYEMANRGFDFEIGRDVYWIKNLKFFAGYYHFENKKNHILPKQNIDGAKFRASYNIIERKAHSLLFESEYSFDDLRKETYFLGLKYRFDFGKIANSKHKLTALQKRMTNEVVRDIDLVLSTIKNQPIFIPLENNSKIIYVDNTKPNGDGTVKSPFNNIKSAESASNINDTIYVYYGDGTLLNNNSGIILKDGQKLIGQGVDFKLSSIITNIDPAQDEKLIPKIDKSKIGNSDSSKYVIQAGNNNLISGLEIGIAGDATLIRSIQLKDKQNITIEDNIINSNVAIETNHNSINKITNNDINRNLTITSSSSELSNSTTNEIINNKIIGTFEIYAKNNAIQNNIIENNDAKSSFKAESDNNSEQSNKITNNILNNFYGTINGNTTFNAKLNSKQNTTDFSNNKVRQIVISSTESSTQEGTFFDNLIQLNILIDSNNNSNQINNLQRNQNSSSGSGQISATSSDSSNQKNNFSSNNFKGNLQLISNGDATGIIAGSTQTNTVIGDNFNGILIVTANNNSTQETLINYGLTNISSFNRAQITSNGTANQINKFNNLTFANSTSSTFTANLDSTQTNEITNSNLRNITFTATGIGIGATQNNKLTSTTSATTIFSAQNKSKQINQLISAQLNARIDIDSFNQSIQSTTFTNSNFSNVYDVTSNGTSNQTNNISGSTISGAFTIRANNTSIQTNTSTSNNKNPTYSKDVTATQTNN